MTAQVLEEHRLTSTPAHRLRMMTAATRVSLKWLGVRRALSPEQRSRAAEPFHAEGDFISAGKKLLDTSHPVYRAVTGVRGNITRYWKSVTLPYPEPGVRLIKQAGIDGFDRQMIEFREQLDEAVARLDEHYAELKTAAERRLGQLYNADDYPSALRGLFEVSWDFPSVEPASYLLELNPAIYEQEKARVAARFQEAVTLAEQAFIDEFSRLVAHLSERLTGGADGETKVFRDSAINNLVEFFDRFRELNVRSNAQLDELVDQAQRLVRGVEPQELRDDVNLRQQVTTQLGQVQAAIDDLMTDMPRRRIIRARAASNGVSDDSAH